MDRYQMTLVSNQAAPSPVVLWAAMVTFAEKRRRFHLFDNVVIVIKGRGIEGRKEANINPVSAEKGHLIYVSQWQSRNLVCTTIIDFHKAGTLIARLPLVRRDKFLGEPSSRRPNSVTGRTTQPSLVIQEIRFLIGVS